MKFYFTENYINGISQKTKQSEIWRQFLPNLNVDTSNAKWEVREMIFPGSGKEGAIWLRCLPWSKIKCHVIRIFLLGQKEMGQIIYILNHRHAGIKKIYNMM